MYFLFAADLNVIYGSLSLLLFFLFSLFLFWLAVLLGAEGSWVAGHVHPSARPGGFEAVLELFLSIRREGSLSTDAVLRKLGNGERDSLTRATRAKQVNGEEPAMVPEEPANAVSETR